MILEGIREVAGSQFPKVLEKAGLSHYAIELPPDDPSPTVTELELSHLYGSTFQVVGETLTRQFLRNYGQKLPDAMLASPTGLEMQARVAEVPASAPASERLGAAIKAIAETGSRVWTNISASEDSEYYYLEISHCAICAEIKGAREPICGNSEVFYGMLARSLSGIRVSALEIECAATGAPRCKYRIRK
jgi:predicted hydrocarbon binding protein